jgi:TatD DNase family protein
MSLVDTHCHLNHAAFENDLSATLNRAREAGIVRLLVIGFDLASSRRAVELARQEPDLRACVGIHPESGAEWDDAARSVLAELAASGTVSAYGEIGLDYHWDSLPRAQQGEIFAEQIAFAASLSADMPLIIHCRDAFSDTLAVLRTVSAPNPVVMHCFTGGVDDARACVEQGYFLGIGGIVTFPKSDALREAVAWCPADRLLLETDCPYLAPQPWRGKRNEPSYVSAVAAAAAACRAVSVSEIEDATTAAAFRLFGWKDAGARS